MEKIKKIRFFLLFLVLTVFLPACQSYNRQVMPVKMPSAYPNAADVAGATVAAKIYESREEAEAVYGFDIVGAGVIPVQVMFDNKGTHPIQIISSNTYLVDAENNVWTILDSNLAHERILKKTEFGQIAPEAAKDGVLSGIAGAIVGAAIGIVTGTNVGDAALKGAAMGAAAGAVVGGTKGYLDPGTQDKIREDIRKWTLENKAIEAGQIANGFLFFPGESAKAKELRLMLKETDTGRTHNLIMGF